MDIIDMIRIAIAEADIILISVIRWVGAVLALTLIFLAVLLSTWSIRPDPYLIDYDKPGVDITSEGPEDGDPWYDEE